MKFTSYLSTSLLLASSCIATPVAVPVQESKFEIQLMQDGIVEREVTDVINKFITEINGNLDLSKRDEQTISSVLVAVNNSDIIFKLLDYVTGSDSIINSISNVTEGLLSNLNISLLLSGGGLSSLLSSINITQILGIVEDSGLLQSIIEGTLLDTDFQPTLAGIVEKAVRANEGLIGIIFNTYLKPASNEKRQLKAVLTSDGALVLSPGESSAVNAIQGELAGTTTTGAGSTTTRAAVTASSTARAASTTSRAAGSASSAVSAVASSVASAISSVAKASTTTGSTRATTSASTSSFTGDASGSLNSFVGNIAGEVLDSLVFIGTLNDTLRALNDTGVALYVIKRILSTDSYIDAFGTIISNVMYSGALNITELTSSINITQLLGQYLDDPDYLVSLATSVLSSNSTSLSSSNNDYTGALQNIVSIMENDGLFVELNSYLFPSSSTAGNKAVASSTMSTSTSGSTSKSGTSSTSSKAGGNSVFIPGSFLSIILGGALFLL